MKVFLQLGLLISISQADLRSKCGNIGECEKLLNHLCCAKAYNAPTGYDTTQFCLSQDDIDRYLGEDGVYSEDFGETNYYDIECYREEELAAFDRQFFPYAVIFVTFLQVV